MHKTAKVWGAASYRGWSSKRHCQCAAIKLKQTQKATEMLQLDWPWNSRRRGRPEHEPLQGDAHSQLVVSVKFTVTSVTWVFTLQDARRAHYGFC